MVQIGVSSAWLPSEGCARDSASTAGILDWCATLTDQCRSAAKGGHLAVQQFLCQHSGLWNACTWLHNCYGTDQHW